METKTIELAAIDNDLDVIEQLTKVTEEYYEFMDEFDNVDFNRDAAVEEGLDLIQATFTMLNKLCLSEEDIKKHLKKMEYYKKIKRV